MRLVYLSNARLPTEKANGYQIMKMCEAFAQNGSETHLIYPRRVQKKELKGVKDIFSFYNVTPCFKSKRLYCLDLPILERLSLGQAWFFLQSKSYAIHSFLYTRKWWRKENIIFYSRDLLTMLLLLGSRRLIKVKLVFEAHVFPGEKYRSRIVSLLQKLDKLVVITHQLKRLFVEAGMPEDKIIVASDAVDLEQFQIKETKEECRQRLGLPINRHIIGYVGRFQTMGMEKGIPELVQAMQYLIEKYTDNPPLLLCVGGPMDCVPYYQSIAKEHNVPTENLQFVDRVPTDQVPYWIRACDVVTIPWTWNEFSAYYTSPMKLFEYMAVGTPIVASDLPSLREILIDGENAILTLPGDAKELAFGISRLLGDPELYKRLVQQSSSDILKYTWKNRGESILNYIIAAHTGF